MKIVRLFTGMVAVVVGVSSCAHSSVTPIAKNQVIINTSAAPACGTDGAAKVASKLAAISTLRQGYERYRIVGAGVQDNTNMVVTGPTFATTYGSATLMGNTAYGSSTTTYGGQQTFLAGRNNAQMQVVMFNRGDPGYEQALDARTTLGPEWQKLVKEGVYTCF